MSTDHAVPAESAPPPKATAPAVPHKRNIVVLGGSMLVDGGETSLVSGCSR
jgi:hypothetical protein